MLKEVFSHSLTRVDFQDFIFLFETSFSLIKQLITHFLVQNQKNMHDFRDHTSDIVDFLLKLKRETKGNIFQNHDKLGFQFVIVFPISFY